MLTKSSDPHHTISKKTSFRPKTGLRIKTKNPQEASFKDVPETQTPTIAYIKSSTLKPSSPRSVLSPQIQRVSSPLLAKSQLFFKRSLSPKELPIGEKPARVFKFKVPPKKGEYGSSSPSEEGKRMVDIRSNRIKTQQSNNFTQEVEKFEQIRKIKEPQIPMAVLKGSNGSKGGSLNEGNVNEVIPLQKFVTEGEEVVPHHIAQSSGFDFSTVSFVRDRQKSASMVLRGGIPRRFASPSASGQEYKLSLNLKTPVAEDNHLLFTEGAEIENQKEVKKSNHPVSQAMFRMREFKKAKSIIMKKNKRKLSITTETTNTNSFASKIPSPRPIESPFAKTRPLFSPQGKAKFFFDNQSENNNMPVFERNRSETIQNFLSTEKTMTTLPDEGLTIRVTKSLEGQVPTQGHLPPEDESQTTTWHFAVKSKASIKSQNNELRRKSELGQDNKIEKYSMKRFLKLTEGSNNSYNTLNSIESPTLPKIPELKEKKRIKEISSPRKPSLEIDISLANSEEKLKKASPRSVAVNGSSPHRKSIFRPPTAIVTAQQSELQQKQSPKFSPLLKPLESPHLRASKPGERNPNNVIKRKKSGNPLEEIDELSQISIKQFELNNDSFELDNLDFIRKTSIKLKQVE